MANVYLTQKDIDYISRVVATEVPPSLKQTDPAEYSRMVNAVVDTMVNRVASPAYPDTITAVANQSRQFSKIAGPASQNPYGSVQAAPKASQELQSMVAGRVADLAQGANSEINGALSYANPNFSDASNLAEWVNPMIEAGAVKLGLGDMVHYHGLAPGQQAVTDVTVSAEGIPSGNIPVPYSPTDDPFANSMQAQATDGLSGVLNPVASETVQRSELAAPAEWGVINGVGPVYTPTVNAWADMAAAKPVSAPFGSILATGDLAANAPLEAGATAGILATPSQPISQADVDRALFNPTGQGLLDPSFTAGLMGPDNAVVPSAVETTSYTAPQSVDIASSRFSTPAKTDRIGTSQTMADAARMNPLTGVINPATNTQSFMPDPNATGVLSAEHQQIQQAAQAALDRALATQAQRQAAESVNGTGILGAPTQLAANAVVNVPSQSGILSSAANMFSPSTAAAAERQASVDAIARSAMEMQDAQKIAAAQPALAAPNFSQAVNPSLPSLSVPTIPLSTQRAVDFMSTASVPGINAAQMQAPQIGILATPQQQAAGYQQAANTLRQAGIMNIGQQPPTNLSGELPTNFDVLNTAPQDTVTDASDPTIDSQTPTINNVAETPAVQQQKAQTISNTSRQVANPQATVDAARNTKSFKDSLLSKETALGGILGGVTLGPVGGILGALAGQQVAANGGLTGLLGGGFTPPTTQIAGGMNNIAGIYGGAFSPGTYAMASNGAQVSSLGGGYTGYTNKYGVNEVVSPTGQISHNFGSFGSKPTDTDAAA